MKKLTVMITMTMAIAMLLLTTIPVVPVQAAPTYSVSDSITVYTDEGLPVVWFDYTLKAWANFKIKLTGTLTAIPPCEVATVYLRIFDTWWFGGYHWMGWYSADWVPNYPDAASCWLLPQNAPVSITSYDKNMDLNHYYIEVYVTSDEFYPPGFSCASDTYWWKL